MQNFGNQSLYDILLLMVSANTHSFTPIVSGHDLHLLSPILFIQIITWGSIYGNIIMVILHLKYVEMGTSSLVW